MSTCTVTVIYMNVLKTLFLAMQYRQNFSGMEASLCICFILFFDVMLLIFSESMLFSFPQKNSLYSTERCKVFQCDLTKDDLLENIPADSVDVVTLIFVLSAIHPDKMHLVLKNIYKVIL